MAHTYIIDTDTPEGRKAVCDVMDMLGAGPHRRAARTPADDERILRRSLGDETAELLLSYCRATYGVGGRR